MRRNGTVITDFCYKSITCETDKVLRWSSYFCMDLFVHPERQISIFFIGTSVAVVLPVYTQMHKQPDYTLGVALCVVTVIGAAAMFFASACVSQDGTWLI
jgi:hypothetical protein